MREWGDGEQKLSPNNKELKISNTKQHREKSALHKCPARPPQTSLHLQEVSSFFFLRNIFRLTAFKSANNNKPPQKGQLLKETHTDVYMCELVHAHIRAHAHTHTHPVPAFLHSLTSQEPFCHYKKGWERLILSSLASR